MKFINKINKIFKNYYFLQSFIVFAFFLVNFFYLKNKLKINPNHTIYKYYLLFSILSLFFFVLIFIMIRKTKNNEFKDFHKIFLYSVIPLGLIYLFVAPLFTGSDEPFHYYRIYEITDGKLLTPVSNKNVGGKLPKSLKDTYSAGGGDTTKIKYNKIIKMYKIENKKNDKILYNDDDSLTSYQNTALYSPISYIPQIIGFLLAKFLGLSPYLIGIFGRIFNLIFYISLGYLAIKITPKFKMFYMLILLSPNMLQCATTLSADAFINVIVLLFLTLIFKEYFTKKAYISNKILVILALLSFIIALCKIVYLPIVFLLFLLNYKKFKYGRKQKYIYCILIIFCSTLLNLLWYNQISNVFDIVFLKTNLQKDFIFNHPIDYLFIIINTYLKLLVWYIECLFVGSMMYNAQISFPSIVSFLYVIIVVCSLLNEKVKIKSEEKIGILGALILIVVLISTAIYVQYTANHFPIGNEIIVGMQGRYFIPIVFLFPYLFTYKSKKINLNLLYSICLNINLITWFYMMNQFLI